MAIFQSFWHGTDLPDHVKACLSSFIDHGHNYKLYAYRDLTLPVGVQLCNANTVLPERNLFYYRNTDGSSRSVAAFANLFRYELLLTVGGWWVDTDVMCLTADINDCEMFFCREDASHICNAILKMPAQHALMHALTKRARSAGRDLVWGQTGPKMLTALLDEMNMLSGAAASCIAYPISFQDYDLPVKQSHTASVASKLHLSSFLHLWNEMFNINSSNLINSPEPGSFLHGLYKKHNIQHRIYRNELVK